MNALPSNFISHRAVLLLAILSGCNYTFGPALQGSGVAKTETRSPAPFSEIEVGGGVQLEVTVGPAPSLEITADDNILPHLRTDVSGDRLNIYVDVSYSASRGIEIKATTPALRALDASGASQTTVTGVKADRFQLDLSGASDCQLAGDVDALDVTLSGASRCTLAGDAKKLAVNCSGASHADAAALMADAATVELSGASTAQVHATTALVAAASGASTLRYAGQPKVERKVSGASTISAE
jgi:hypothetical protein